MYVCMYHLSPSLFQCLHRVWGSKVNQATYLTEAFSVECTMQLASDMALGCIRPITPNEVSCHNHTYLLSMYHFAKDLPRFG